ncbi:MAG TPA: uroporphyrinogen-III C-methyltransferase, partial [Casimicrobiaceae bacterium]|nr:uroporphyrinogen-III C-methyltransferase [Casimicrobiaceae bacterium]
MQTTEPDPDRIPGANDSGTAAPSPVMRTRAGRATRLLWLVLAIAVAAAAYGWYEQSRVTGALRTDVAQRLAAVDAATALTRERESDLGNQLRDALAKLALLETRVAEFQSQQASLEALYRELAPSRDELALSEVEQILVLAGQQLSLAGNVQAALAGLQVADAKLARLDRPQLGALRRALARDIDRLKAVPYVDVAGISI